MSLIGGAVVFAAAMAASSQENARRAPEPWEWRSEDRVRARTDPLFLQKRNAEQEKLRTQVQRGEYGGRYVLGDPGKPAILGWETPELFLPFELFDALRSTFDSGEGARYTAAIREAGWDEGQFWRVLQIATTNLRAAEEGLAQSRVAPPEGVLDEANLNVCRARAAAIQQMREAFGHEALDRFLYGAVAPSVAISGMDDRELLLFVDRGCR
jgi:hypothetical protein